MKRIAAAFVLLALLLTGCTAKHRFSNTYLDAFDTVTTVTGLCTTEREFQEQAQKIHEALLAYHRAFDVYHSYEGLNNLKTVNDNAGIAPVTVDDAILELLQFCREFYDLTDGKVNAAMGSVLNLWHEAREYGLEHPESACLPDPQLLAEAAEYTDFDRVELDLQAKTVYLPAGMRLDVGAMAKGWTAQRLAENLPEGWLLNLGGNTCATGGKTWIIGIQNPDGDDLLQTVAITCGSVVTSGDYQRYYTVAGKSYHHIIDPATQMPAELWRAVTVICPDSGAADGLSTALFLLPQTDGQALLEHFGAEALWVCLDGTLYQSPGFAAYLQ